MNQLAPGRFAVVLATLALLLIAVPGMAQERQLSEVLAEFDRVQELMQTLSAGFTETTEAPLLKEPIVARGRVYLTKPDAVRWEYSEPEEMRFVINADEYTGYFPKRKRAERRDVGRWREQLFRLLGLGQPSAELSKFYDITLDGTETVDGRELLILDLAPRKKRVRKRMDAVRFWIDPDTYLPRRVKYNAKNGNRRTIEFFQMVLNPELAAGLYNVELPEDVEITKGFSALSGISATD